MTTPTLSQLGEMTDEELNVRLAELLGVVCGRCEGTGRYKAIGDHDAFRMSCQNKGVKPDQYATCDHLTNDPRKPYTRLLPRYCSDANAVAEVRKGLVTPDQRRRFVVTLKDLVLVDAAAWFEADFRLIDALPRQQTIAAIATLTP